jgi:hypothetical protein
MGRVKKCKKAKDVREYGWKQNSETGGEKVEIGGDEREG